MALTKKSLNNFLPNGFETQNKEGYKANFTNDRILSGYEKDTLEILSGPNLNNFIDKTGKNFNTLNDLLEYFNEMPIDSFPIVNASNQLDYKSINSFFRNVGELVFSSVPIDDKNLHLADGSLLDGKGTYRVFVDFIGKMATKYPNLFTDEATWQATVSKYGTCGKYVWNAENKTLRLPRLKGIVEATIDQNSIGNITEAGLPNITGQIVDSNDLASYPHLFTGAFKFEGTTNAGREANDKDGATVSRTTFDASRSSKVYGKSNTVQPQTVKQYIYIVVSVDTEETTKLTSVFQYRGSVPTFDELPKEGNITGDVWNVDDTDVNYVWDGAEWDQLSGSVDLTGYYTKEQADTRFATVTSLESNVENLQAKITQNTTDIASLGLGDMVASSLEKGKALKYLETKGNITEDADVYNDVYNYKHSTFDLSKFTIVGSPTITDDGVASGFSNSNYLTIPNYLKGKRNYEIDIEFTLPETLREYGYIFCEALGTTGLSVYYDTTNVFIRCVSSGVNRFTKSIANGNYKLKIKYNNGTASLQYCVNNAEEQTYQLNVSNYVDFQADILYLSARNNNGNIDGALIGGSIDLKQFSITVDGEEVFNGNKNGLDVIKPDNYTVVGSPTITEDGIVSNIGQELSSKIEFNISTDMFKDKSWSIETLGYYPKPTNQNKESFIFQCGYVGDSEWGAISYGLNAGKIVVRGYTGSEKLRRGLFIETFVGYNIHFIRCKLDFNINEGKYTLYFDIGDNNWIIGGSCIPTSENKQLSSILTLRNKIFLNSYYQTRDDLFDLNLYKFYIDGKLVYQPCLKIPYNISKTGLKVANADARERIIGMAEDYGYSQYFTIDEENKNATLPIGAGITGRQDLIASFDDGTNKYEQFSDLTFKQSGKCTANTAVTFIQPYKDDTYKLSVPYSAKTKTGFTPTVSGDWFAEGKIYLD